jgi:competence protein ComEC
MTSWRAALLLTAAAAALLAKNFMVEGREASQTAAAVKRPASICPERLSKGCVTGLDKNLLPLLFLVFLCALIRSRSIMAACENDINARLAEDSFVKIEGLVSSVKTGGGGDRARYSTAVLSASKYFDAKTRSFRPAAGKLFLNIRYAKDDPETGGGAKREICEGGLIQAAGRLKSVHKYKNPYLSSGYNPLKHEIRYILEACPINVRTFGNGSSAVFSLKNKAEILFLKHFPPEISGFLIAFALGDPARLSESAYFDNAPSFDFCESGMVHVLVVSGGHVTMMIAYLTALLNLLKMRPAIKSAVLFAVVSVYFSIIGLQAAATRAYLSFALFSACGLFGRDTRAINIFIAAMFFHAVCFPELLFSAGFWLSYVSTFAIIAAGGYKIECRGDKIYANALLNYCKITAAALISTYPAISYAGGYFPANAILSNICTLWIYETVLALCFIFVIFSLFSSYLTWAAAAALYHISFAALKLNEYISSIPMGNLAVYKLGLGEMLLFYSLAVVIIYALSSGVKISGAAAAKTAVILSLIIFVRSSAAAYFEGPEISFLDVGQGDCALIRTAAGKWIMIDAGGGAASYEKVILPYLRYRHISEFEYLIVTHAHSDHYCGALKLYKNAKIEIKTLCYSSGWENGDRDFKKLLAGAYNKKMIFAGDRLSSGGVTIDILWPSGNNRGMRPQDDVNASSIAAAVNMNGRSFLFCGDITSAVEEEILEKISGYRFDFIKAPHHGSKTSNSEKFIEAAAAGGVYIPCGASNKFGHPHAEVLDRYRNNGYKIFNSKNCGGIILKTVKRLKILDHNMAASYL